MILRWLAREFREFPATTSICLIWIVVFAAMTYKELETAPSVSALRWLVVGFGGGEAFGDLTLNDLANGQVWRLMTCNFVHYSLIHIGFNLLAMYQLGGFIESWYGSYQLVFIYGVTGAGGNLLSVLARFWLESSREVHSAGGSVAIMGMVGLCAVVGLRSSNPDGRRLGRVMLLFIGLTAVLGAIFYRYIDNWGHGGGLAMGIALGCAHRWLRARLGTPAAWEAGVLTGLIIAGCAAVQFVTERRDGPARLERSLVLRSNYLARARRELSWLQQAGPPPDHLVIASKWLAVLDPYLDRTGQTEAQALQPLVAAAIGHPLDDQQHHELTERLARLLAAMRQQYEHDRRQLGALRGTH